MATFRLLSSKQFKSQPWKNGLGVTTQMRIEPDSADFVAGTYQWRISSARVSENGPFSLFPGYDRTLVVLDGNGMTLRNQSGREQVLRALDVAQFSGDELTSARLTDEPITDLNIFTRRASHSTAVSIMRASTQIDGPQQNTSLIYCVVGEYLADGQLVKTGELLEVSELSSEITATPKSKSCIAVLIRIAPVLL